MRVIATAGHVDHGKSTLVRALTGMEPDRWAEERRRGMTIDLGYAWTELAGELLAFVDVPGHERFLANMLAGLGPAPAVLFVVAADQGWQAQSDEHLAAVRALGLSHALLAVTRSDLADPSPARTDALAQLAAAGLPDVPAVTVSGATGAGLDDLRAALAALVAGLPAPRTDGRVRLWVDRSFTVRGAGTVVTGTLDAGTVAVGGTFELRGDAVRVRGLQSAGQDHTEVHAVARVAVNLRGLPRDDVSRGDVLLTPGAWPRTGQFDARIDPGSPVAAVSSGAGTDWSGELMLHVGTAAVPVQVRPLGADLVRIRLRHALPLVHGDRAVLRNPGTRAITGVQVLDADPPALRRRGAAARRAQELTAQPQPQVTAEVVRRGAVRTEHLVRLGFDPQQATDVRQVAGWLVTEDTWARWADGLRAAVTAQAASDPLAPGLSPASAAGRAGVPDPSLLDELAWSAGLVRAGGLLTVPDARPSLGRAEAAVLTLESRLARTPFRAPERPELAELGLGPRELAVAARNGRLLSLPGDVVLRADAPSVAVETLAGLPQPFSLSQARVALDTTRRVAVPLLEHLDSLGLTERLDGVLRAVRRAGTYPTR